MEHIVTQSYQMHCVSDFQAYLLTWTENWFITPFLFVASWRSIIFFVHTQKLNLSANKFRRYYHMRGAPESTQGSVAGWGWRLCDWPPPETYHHLPLSPNPTSAIPPPPSRLALSTQEPWHIWQEKQCRLTQLKCDERHLFYFTIALLLARTQNWGQIQWLTLYSMLNPIFFRKRRGLPIDP